MRRYSPLFIAIPWLVLGSAVQAGEDTAKDTNTNEATEKIPGSEAGQETSDRTPEKKTEVPASQTTDVDGETSDRTPKE